MELTPQSLHSVEFREARRGGYNTRDVDDFIERVAVGAGQLNERMREAQLRADAAEARLGDLQREVEDLRRRPAPEASETDETLRRTLVLAQRTADATIKEAKEEANRVLSEAREEAARTRAEAEADARRGADMARVNAQAEVESLLSSRDKLETDINLLTRRIEEQRTQLKAGLSELQHLLDDPDGLKPVPPVSLAQVERPAPLPADQPAEAASADGDQPADDEEPADVTSLQEAPSSPADLNPPTQPVPFALAGDGGNRQWTPADLQGPPDEPLGPRAVASPAGNGTPTPPPDSSARPAEWGRAVFEAEPGDERARFGRRR